MDGPRKVMVAVDGSEGSDEAFKYALSLLDGEDSVIALHVQQEFPGGDWPEGIVAYEALQLAQSREEENCRQLFRHYQKMVPLNGPSFTSMTAVGDARTEICDAAKQGNVDLVVMGSRGLGRIRRMMLGSVSDAVVRSCPCPVLIVRPPKENTL